MDESKIQHRKVVLRLVVSCGLIFAVLSGAAAAQQPTTVAPSGPSAGQGPGVSDGANGRAVPSCVSERERILIERVEAVERRLIEVEMRITATGADGGKAAATTAQP